jgi:regulator of replication initiation timing
MDTEKLYSQKELDRQLDNQKEDLMGIVATGSRETRKLLKEIKCLREDKEALELEVEHLKRLLNKYKELAVLKERVEKELK